MVPMIPPQETAAFLLVVPASWLSLRLTGSIPGKGVLRMRGWGALVMGAGMAACYALMWVTWLIPLWLLALLAGIGVPAWLAVGAVRAAVGRWRDSRGGAALRLLGVAAVAATVAAFVATQFLGCALRDSEWVRDTVIVNHVKHLGAIEARLREREGAARRPDDDVFIATAETMDPHWAGIARESSGPSFDWTFELGPGPLEYRSLLRDRDPQPLFVRELFPRKVAALGLDQTGAVRFSQRRDAPWSEMQVLESNVRDLTYWDVKPWWRASRRP